MFTYIYLLIYNIKTLNFCVFTCMYVAVMELPFFFDTTSRSGYLEDAIADWKYGFEQQQVLPHSPGRMVWFLWNFFSTSSLISVLFEPLDRELTSCFQSSRWQNSHNLGDQVDPLLNFTSMAAYSSLSGKSYIVPYQFSFHVLHYASHIWRRLSETSFFLSLIFALLHKFFSRCKIKRLSRGARKPPNQERKRKPFNSLPILS